MALLPLYQLKVGIDTGVNFNLHISVQIPSHSTLILLLNCINMFHFYLSMIRIDVAMSVSHKAAPSDFNTFPFK
jgi:hypothetical protein